MPTATVSIVIDAHPLESEPPPSADTEANPSPPTPDPALATPDLAPATEDVAVDLDAISSDLDATQVALDRLADGTYWSDEVTGEPIPDDVLDADPTARRAR